MTVVGGDFGVFDSSVRGRLGESVCFGVMSWVSDSGVSCRVVGGRGQGLSVGICVAGQCGSMLNAVSYDSRFVSSVLPVNSPTSGNTCLIMCCL